MRAVREAGLTRMLGVAPGPANGFTLDLIDCLERFSEQIDWAMIILNPLEPWPGELALDAAAAHEVSLITRVVDYGGIFHDDVLPGHVFAEYDHRKFRPAGMGAGGPGEARADAPLRRAPRAHDAAARLRLEPRSSPVRCVAPTLIQESGPDARPIEDKRAELAALPTEARPTAAELQAIRAIGENVGCMALKGASAEYEGPALADRWALTDELQALAARWKIVPDRDLARGEPSTAI